MTLPSDKPLAPPQSDHGEPRPSPEAAHDAPVRYAQVTSDSAIQPIGKVETLEGDATLQHNGTTVAVTKDMPVYQGDLVSAGAHSNVGIVFVDKSVFSINDGGSMTLDNFVYNPAATTSNSMLFNLVKGTAGFITGQVVKTGDMEVGTPVAVIAVRGTTVIVQCPAEVLAHPSCSFKAATGHFDLKVGGQVLTSVGLEAVKVQDGHFSFDLTPKTPEEQQNYNSIINTLQNSASSANIELHKEGGLIETHPTHEVQVEIAFNDGTTYSSPLDTFAAVATIAGASTAGGAPNPSTQTTGEETTTAAASVTTTTTESPPPLVSTDNAPVITSGPQSGAVTEIADTTGNNTLHMQNGAITFTDADATDTHTASVTAQGAEYLGTFALGTVNETTGSVAWTFAVQDGALDFLKAGQQLVQTYNVQVNDGNGGTASEVVNITLTGSNDAPVIVAEGTVATGSVDAVAEQQSSVNADYPIVGSELLNGLGGSAGFGENMIQPNDDGSSQAIDITSLFGSSGLDFFGHNYTQLYVNNNGNVTFGSPLSTFTPQTIGANLGFPIIAAFWADVDTGGGPATATPGGNSTGSDIVSYDLDTTHGVFTATWDDVGYFSQHTSKLDAFQLQLINRGSGDFDIVFRYEAVNWTTGDASNGIDGLGGSVARAGYSAGDNNPSHTFEIPQSGDQLAMLSLPQTQGNDGIEGVYVYHVHNGVVVDSQLTANGVVNFSDVDAGDVHTASAAYTGPGSALGTLSLVKNVDTSDPGSDGLGQFAWTYSVDNNALASLGAQDAKTESFLVSIRDGNGGVATQTVSVTLHGVNDPPVTTAEAAITDNATVLNGTVVDHTTDPDNNPATDLTYAVVGATPAGLAFNADGTWSFDPGGQFDSLAHGETATVSFDYQANDGIADSNVSTATITVTGANSAPVLAVADTAGQLTEGDGNALLTAAGSLSVSDADTGDTVTVSPTYNGDIVWSGGTLDSTLAAALVAGFDAGPTGWSYATTQNLDFLAAGDTITFSYTLVATDSSGAANDTSTPATVTITIDGTADTMNTTVNGTSGDDNLMGTSGNDLILPGDATADGGDTIHASAGNDTIDFTGAHNGSYILDYSSLGSDLTANITTTGGTIDKGSLGIDSLVNFDSINGLGGGAHLLGGSGNDSFTVDLSSTESLSIQVGTGADTITATGSGYLEVDVSTYHGAYVDATEGIVSEVTGTAGATVTGTVNEWQGSQYADTLMGSSADESFHPGGGSDAVDGGGGFDVVRYDVVGVDSIHGAFTAPGTAVITGTANGQMFIDTLTNIEAIIGTSGSDVLAGSSSGELLDGQAGNDVLVGGGGGDTLYGGTGMDILQDGAGANILDVGADNVGDLVRFTPDALNAGDVSDLIINFNSGTDGVDLSQLFTVNTNTGDMLSDYVQIQNVAGTTEVQIDANGATGGHNYSAIIATFDTSLSAGTTVNVLYSQDGSPETASHVTVV